MATALTFKSESGDFYTYVSHDGQSVEEITEELKQVWWAAEASYLESWASHEFEQETVNIFCNVISEITYD